MASCISADCRPKSKSQQRDEKRKFLAKLDVASEKLEAYARNQQETRVEKYALINVAAEQIGSPGHTPQQYRDAYQDFTDLYGDSFEDETEGAEDGESVASDSTTLSERYNMFNISPTALRMARGFPGWAPFYPKGTHRVHGSDSECSSYSSENTNQAFGYLPDIGYCDSFRPYQQTAHSDDEEGEEDKEEYCSSVQSVTYSPSPGLEQPEFGPLSLSSLSPPHSPNYSNSLYSLSSSGESNNNNNNVDAKLDKDEEDKDKDTIIYPSIETDDPTEPPTTQPEGDSDDTLTDPDREGSESITGGSDTSVRRTNRPVNHQFFYLHHRVTKRTGTSSVVPEDSKRAKVDDLEFA
ncbi:TPA_exp: Uncharacterized protein A8136_5466 [Trichophyton benhamiae CBS 112371]|nr:TPA_exp: Uncharacterized protein A8136_5466 [Trichophyton benhamiae CBS 112371]